MLESALGHAGAHRLQISIDTIDGFNVCRIDVPASSRAIWATLKGNRQLFQRRNNSTRAVPADEVEDFIAERFPAHDIYVEGSVSESGSNTQS